jgi:hypothetical protein
MEELYDRVSTNSHECFFVTFPTLHICFIYIKHAYFANSHEIHFGTTENSLL